MLSHWCFKLIKSVVSHYYKKPQAAPLADWDPTKELIIKYCYKEAKRLLVELKHPNLDMTSSISIAKYHKNLTALHRLSVNASEEYKKECKKIKETIKECLSAVVDDYEKKVCKTLQSFDVLPLPQQLATLVIEY